MISRIPKSFKQACETAFVPLIKITPTRLVAAVILSIPAAAFAGEIAGLPANTPPSVEAPLTFSFSNDFLGRGATTDDFRTQQFIIGGTIGNRWELTLDHSLLTLVDPVDDIDRAVRISSARHWDIEFLTRLATRRSRG